MTDNTRRPYALIETNFILNDPNYYTLPAPARCLYIALWCLAVSERSELIRRPSPSYAALISGSSPNHTAMMIKACADHNLLIERDDWLIIVGVAKKHNKINIKSFSNEKEQSEKVPELSGVKRSEVELNETPPIIPPKGNAPVKPERKVKKESKPPSEYREFTDWFIQEYEARFNEKYMFTKKDGVLAAGMFKSLGLEELKRRTLIFFDSDDPWILNAGKTIPILHTKINSLADCSSGKPKISQKFQNSLNAIDRVADLIEQKQKEAQNGDVKF